MLPKQQTFHTVLWSKGLMQPVFYILFQSIPQKSLYSAHVWDSSFSELTFTQEVIRWTTKTWITFLCL